MDFEPEFDEVVTEEKKVYDKYDANVEIQIMELVTQLKIVTDRELKVRLEKGFFPWVVGRGLNKLVREGSIKLVSPPGRKGAMGSTDNFFMEPAADYNKNYQLMMEKRKYSFYVNTLLTRAAPAGFYAEQLFDDAFKSLKFKIHGYDVSEFKGKKVTGIPGKQPPDLDFVIERDGIIYGVDIKNWLKYEYDTIDDVMQKVKLAQELEIIPFICARYIDKTTLYRISELPGLVYMYKTLILPPEFKEVAEGASSLLGYPVLYSNVLPAFKIAFIENLHGIMLKKLKKK